MQSPKSLSIAGTGQNVPLAANHLGARFITLFAPAANGSAVMIGGDKNDAPLFPLIAGSYVTYWGNGVEPMGFYFLDEAYVNIANGDTLKVLYGG